MSTTKESIVILADDLIRRRGYNAFSYNDISKVLAIKNAAIHYHFPSKSDLGVAVIEYHIQKVEQFIKSVDGLPEDQKVSEFLNIYDQIQSNKKICLVGSLASDWDTIDEKIQTKLTMFAHIVANWLTEVLENGVKSGSLNYKGESRTRAMLIITSIMAAAQMARIMGPESFQSVKSAIFNELQRK